MTHIFISYAKNDTPARKAMETITELAKPASTHSKVYDFLPTPFDWIDIPAGKVTLEAGGYVPEDGQTFEVAAFQIAKYPITDAQFEVFLQQGYADAKWWDFSAEAAAWRSEFTRIRSWTGDDLPRTDVTWYAAVAFCRWLSDATGENIILPTEQQWQRAAQGDDGRVYPWGNKWDAGRCNSWETMDRYKTTPVRQYEGKGDSPFGVVDTAGNVWEWCLTDYNKGTNDINMKVERRVVRGGSSDYIRRIVGAVYRNYEHPVYSSLDIGFRVLRVPSR